MSENGNGNGNGGNGRNWQQLVAVGFSLVATGGMSLLAYIVQDKTADIAEVKDLIRDVRAEAKQERAVMREEFLREFNDLDDGRLKNAERIARLENDKAEVETQIRNMNHINNLEHQLTLALLNVLQQCNNAGAKCTVPDRGFWPAGPGPNGKHSLE